jgi:hypothetical protein
MDCKYDTQGTYSCNIRPKNNVEKFTAAHAAAHHTTSSSSSQTKDCLNLENQRIYCSQCSKGFSELNGKKYCNKSNGCIKGNNPNGSCK